MRNLVLAAGAALALAACGGADQTEANTANGMSVDANVFATDNMMYDQNAMGNTAGNMALDPTTQNMIQQDMNTNSPDTNLANGL